MSYPVPPQPAAGAPVAAPRTGGAVVVMAVFTFLIAVPFICWAAYMAVSDLAYESDWQGIATLIAAIVAAPMLLGSTLSGIGFALRKRPSVAGTVLAAIGLCMCLGNALFLASLISQGQG